MVELHPRKGKTRRVIFTLLSRIEACSAALVRNFLDKSGHSMGFPMTRCSDGSWRLASELEAGQTHEFCYRVNGCEWHNDHRCRQIPNLFGNHNSVFFVPQEDKQPLASLPQSTTLKRARRKGGNGFPSSHLSSLFQPERSLRCSFGITKGGGYVPLHFVAHRRLTPR